MRLPTNEKSFRFFIFIRISVFLETMSYIPQTPKTKQIQILRNHLQLLLLFKKKRNDAVFSTVATLFIIVAQLFR